MVPAPTPVWNTQQRQQAHTQHSYTPDPPRQQQVASYPPPTGQPQQAYPQAVPDQDQQRP